MIISHIESILNTHFTHYEVYSFDFFDTLIQRKVDERQLVKQGVRDFFNTESFVIDEQLFIKEIEQAEVDERYATQLLGFDKEAQLIAIYRRVFSILNISHEQLTAFTAFIVDREKHNFILVDGAIKILSKLKKANKKVVITSDSYYSRSDFSDFLNHLAISSFVDTIYLSSEVKLNKASGKMFNYLLMQENVAAECILHIGDNVFSDGVMAKKIGLDTLNIQHESLLSDEAKHQALFDFGYEYFAPILYDFIEQLVEQQTENNALFFLARDGYLLRSIFNLFHTKHGSSYLYINRIIANQITTKCLNKTVIASISSHYKSEGLFGLVTVFGLNNTPFACKFSFWLKQQGLNKNTFIDESNSQLLLNNSLLVQAFEHSLAIKQANALKYINYHISQQSVQNISLVDIGWRGTIAKQLMPLFTRITRCCLFAYTEGIQTNNNNITLDGYINNSNQYKQYLPFISENRDIIEYFLSENLSNIIGIDKNLEVEYLTDNNEPLSSEPRLNQARSVVQKAVLMYCQRRRATNKNLDEKNKDKHLANFQQFFAQPPALFYQAMSDITVDINIQGKSSVTMQQLLSTNVVADDKETAQNIKNKQSILYQFLTFVKTLQAENTLVLYGAGSGAEFILPHLNNCYFIVDINEKIQGNHIKNTPIKPLSELMHFSGSILVTVLGRKNQIKQTIMPFLSDKNTPIYFLEDYL